MQNLYLAEGWLVQIVWGGIKKGCCNVCVFFFAIRCNRKYKKLSELMKVALMIAVLRFFDGAANPTKTQTINRNQEKKIPPTLSSQF